jgi:hypothetical protein
VGSVVGAGVSARAFNFRGGRGRRVMAAWWVVDGTARRTSRRAGYGGGDWVARSPYPAIGRV